MRIARYKCAHTNILTDSKESVFDYNIFITKVNIDLCNNFCKFISRDH